MNKMFSGFFCKVVYGFIFLIFVQCVFVGFGFCNGQSSYEIVIGGKRYKSIDEYRNNKKKLGTEELYNGTSVDQYGKEGEGSQQVYGSESVSIDSQKTKTIILEPSGEKTMVFGLNPMKEEWLGENNQVNFDLCDDLCQSFQALSVDGPVKDSIAEFNSGVGDAAKKVISPEMLEQVLEKTFSGHNEPLLLMIGQNKIRILTHEPTTYPKDRKVTIDRVDGLAH